MLQSGYNVIGVNHDGSPDALMEVLMSLGLSSLDIEQSREYLHKQFGHLVGMWVVWDTQKGKRI